MRDNRVDDQREGANGSLVGYSPYVNKGEIVLTHEACDAGVEEFGRLLAVQRWEIEL